MTILKSLAGLLLLALAAAAVAGRRLHARDSAQRQAVWDALGALREPAPPRFDSAMVADLPEVARRYLTRAIAAGTPLHRTVELEMAGTFILNGKAMPMTARQRLAPPARGFVWDAVVGQGAMRFAGSDGYHRANGRETSWTKFWLGGVVPLVRVGDTPDHARAAATRVLLESLWAPASLLPQYGAQWVQTGPHTADVHAADAPGLPPLRLTLSPQGDPVEMWAMRWSDANPEKRYRLQPFGGRVLETREVQGFRVPTRVELGNGWGTPAYTPFFLATIGTVRF